MLRFALNFRQRIGFEAVETWNMDGRPRGSLRMEGLWEPAAWAG